MSKRRKIKKGRLRTVFKKFAYEYDFSATVNDEDNSARILIPIDSNAIDCFYQFDPSENGYEFTAALSNVDEYDLNEISLRLLISPPTRGITERFADDKLVLLGSKVNLQNLSDIKIKRNYMDDIKRIKDYFIDLDNRLNGNKIWK